VLFHLVLAHYQLKITENKGHSFPEVLWEEYYCTSIILYLQADIIRVGEPTLQDNIHKLKGFLNEGYGKLQGQAIILSVYLLINEILIG
jgi:hypothetical protein